MKEADIPYIVWYAALGIKHNRLIKLEMMLLVGELVERGIWPAHIAMPGWPGMLPKKPH
jgi:hypothetical protein